MKGTTSKERAGELDIERRTTRLYRALKQVLIDNEAQADAFKSKKEAIIPLKQKDIALPFRY
jgi:hypothetical protein